MSVLLPASIMMPRYTSQTLEKAFPPRKANSRSGLLNDLSFVNAIVDASFGQWCARSEQTTARERYTRVPGPRGPEEPERTQGEGREGSHSGIEGSN